MTSRSLLFFMLGFTLIGCAASERFTRHPDPLEVLRADIDRILADSIFEATATSIKIYSPEQKEILYERGSKQLLRPASNMKILTAIGAIMRLGPEHRFTTAVLADTIHRSANAARDLYLRGGGNSELRTSHLDSLARTIASSGIRTIRGSLIADNSYFDTTWFGKGWMWDDEPFSFGAPISALSLNKNCVRVTVTPAPSAGAAPVVGLDPPTAYMSVVNNARTVSDTVRQALTITRSFAERQNLIRIEGEILAGARVRSELVSVWRPDLYAATVFKELLEKAGIRVEGGIRSGKTPPQATMVAAHTLPLDSILMSVNKMSDNLSAESLLRTLTVVADSSTQSPERGVSEINRLFYSLGVDTSRYLQADGSGVSHYNLISAETIVDLLTRFETAPDNFSILYNTLPIAGIDGTLSSRMIGTRAQGNVRAKTGTMSGISSLSGYVTTLDGERLAFSILMQNFLGSSRPYRDTQDAICVRLANFTRARIEMQTP